MSLGILDKPTLSECKITPRFFQTEAINAVQREFASGKKSTLVVLPTGTGKTPVLGIIARRCVEKGNRVLVLAHRDELIEQAVNKFDMVGVEAAIEKAGQRARSLYEPDVVVATVQTMKGDRLDSWPPDYFRLIETDEAHHAISPSYRNIYKHFPKAYHLGVTATVDRADEEDLGQVFQSIAYEYSLWDAMRATNPGPYLCRLRFVQCDVDIDLRDLKPREGDFTQKDLENRIKPLVNKLANAIRQEIDDRRTLIFTPDVGSAQAMGTAMASLGFNADWVSGNDPERDRKINKFRKGQLQVLANCAIATEGFDVPEIAAVVLCRPTKSRLLYSQMVGRGTRLKDGGDCLIVDFNYLTAKHDLVRPVELFDTTHTDVDVLDIAQDLVKKDKNLSLDLAVERAVEINKEQQVLRIKAREQQVQYRRNCYDPLAVSETLGIPWRGSTVPNKNVVMATSNQVAFLTKLKVENAASMSKTRASTMIDYLLNRLRKKLATHKQVATLIKFGVPPDTARAMTFDDASARLDMLIGGHR